MVRISKAVVLDGFRVRLTLTDGSLVERDLDGILVGPVFETVRNPDMFSKVEVRDGGLVWPCGVDLCPDMVIWGGPPPVDAADRAS